MISNKPWTDKQGKYGEFSRYTVDQILAARIGRITVFNSLDDSQAIQANAHRIVSSIPDTQLIELDGYGHFILGNAMRTEEFPELLSALLGE